MSASTVTPPSGASLSPPSSSAAANSGAARANGDSSRRQVVSAREHHVFMAKLSERAERYPEMVEHVKKIVQLDPKLSIEERNLLSVAYKSVVGANRASWRIIATIEHKEAARSNSQSENHDDGGDDLECSPYLKDIQDYRKKVEGELEIISRDILGLLDGALIPAAESDESRVFYLKLKGDYLRYMAEFMAGSAKKAVSDAALAAYESATDAALTSLSPTLPIRLGLALNFSVFHYEIMADAAAACRLARQAFDEALVHIDGLSEEAYKDSTLIMQLLRDNLSLWTAEAQELGKKTDEAAK